MSLIDSTMIDSCNAEHLLAHINKEHRYCRPFPGGAIGAAVVILLKDYIERQASKNKGAD